MESEPVQKTTVYMVHLACCYLSFFSSVFKHSNFMKPDHHIGEWNKIAFTQLPCFGRKSIECMKHTFNRTVKFVCFHSSSCFPSFFFFSFFLFLFFFYIWSCFGFYVYVPTVCLLFTPFILIPCFICVFKVRMSAFLC